MAWNTIEVQQNDAGNREKDQRDRFQAGEDCDSGNPGWQRCAEKGQAAYTRQFQPGIVLSGSVEGIQAAAAKAKDKGIKRAIPLPVAGAYHSRLMKSAQDKLAAVLASSTITEPTVPVVCNFEAREVKTPEEIRATLTAQVTGSVRWVESMQALRAAGHTLFIELGPDATLAGLFGKIDKEAKVISIKDLASLDAAVAELTA